MTRSFFKGKFQKIPFKGRDIYDLYWLLQLSAKTGYTLNPNIAQLMALLAPTPLTEIVKQIKKKISLINAQFVYDDIYPLVESKEIIDQFLKDFGNVISQQIDYVLHE